MRASCANGVAHASARAIAARASRRRGQSGARDRAITRTAWATTATAAILSPWTHPAPDRSEPAANRPSAIISTAAGSVKPTHAANAPASPALREPTAIPSCELAGPGSAWQSATRSANSASPSQPRRSTYSRRK